MSLQKAAYPRVVVEESPNQFLLLLSSAIVNSDTILYSQMSAAGSSLTVWLQKRATSLVDRSAKALLAAYPRVVAEDSPSDIVSPVLDEKRIEFA